MYSRTLAALAIVSIASGASTSFPHELSGKEIREQSKLDRAEEVKYYALSKLSDERIEALSEDEKALMARVRARLDAEAAEISTDGGADEGRATEQQRDVAFARFVHTELDGSKFEAVDPERRRELKLAFDNEQVLAGRVAAANTQDKDALEKERGAARENLLRLTLPLVRDEAAEAIATELSTPEAKSRDKVVEVSESVDLGHEDIFGYKKGDPAWDEPVATSPSGKAARRARYVARRAAKRLQERQAKAAAQAEVEKAKSEAEAAAQAARLNAAAIGIQTMYRNRDSNRADAGAAARRKVEALTAAYPELSAHCDKLEAELRNLQKDSAANVATIPVKQVKLEECIKKRDLIPGKREEARKAWLNQSPSLSKVVAERQSLDQSIKQAENAISNAQSPAEDKAKHAELQKLLSRKSAFQRMNALSLAEAVDFETETAKAIAKPALLAGLQSATRVSDNDEDGSKAGAAYAAQHGLKKLVEAVEEVAKKWKAEYSEIQIFDKNGDFVSPRPQLFKDLKAAVGTLRDACLDSSQPVDIKAIIRKAVGNAEGVQLANEIAETVDLTQLNPAYFAKRRAQAEGDEKLLAAQTAAATAASQAAEALAAEKQRAETFGVANAKLQAELDASKTGASQAAEALIATKQELETVKAELARKVAEPAPTTTTPVVSTAESVGSTEGDKLTADPQTTDAAGLAAAVKAKEAAEKAQKEAEDGSSRKMWVAIIVSSVVFVLSGVGAFFYIRGRV